MDLRVSSDSGDTIIGASGKATGATTAKVSKVEMDTKIGVKSEETGAEDGSCGRLCISVDPTPESESRGPNGTEEEAASMEDCMDLRVSYDSGDTIIGASGKATGTTTAKVSEVEMDTKIGVIREETDAEDGSRGRLCIIADPTPESESRGPKGTEDEDASDDPVRVRYGRLHGPEGVVRLRGYINRGVKRSRRRHHHQSKQGRNGHQNQSRK
ncbi:hypothetical protein NDU88_006618 [Pleurodeles waltl]|uniref:Uncharacterized protein n=1 Tax=Pleurodeles waltl TaxID=8319 RepID=A0AAV7QLR2_PLEWA|nr:hypothetical protein NDU88_006618 [Pleurodeles waltl]